MWTIIWSKTTSTSKPSSQSPASGIPSALVAAISGAFVGLRACYIRFMAHPQTLPDIDDDEAELGALSAAVAKARANRRGVSQEEMKAWLLRIAAGESDAPPPVVRDL